MQFTRSLSGVVMGAALLLLARTGHAQGPAAPAPAPAAAAGASKVATIDMMRAINETNEGARASDTLKKYYDKRQAELNTRQDDMLKERTAIEKRCRTQSQAQCQASMEELQKKLAELQGLMGQYQQDIQKRQSEATQPMIAKMTAIVGRLARQNGYDLVVDRAVVHFNLPGTDLTEQAIKLYNTESPAQPLPPPGAADKAPPAKKPAKK